MSGLIALIRFHDHFDVTRNCLDVFRHFNPNVPVCGIFGGISALKSPPSELKDAFDYYYEIPSDDIYWNWKNADLVVRAWFKDQGHKLPYTRIHITEWDLLTLLDISALDKKWGQNTHAVSKAFSYKQAQEFGWDWIQENYEEWELLRNHLEKKHAFTSFDDCKFGIMGGMFLSRVFLEKYVEEYPPSYDNDEVRLGLYSKLWGFETVDNEFNKIGKEYFTALSDTEYKKFNNNFIEKGIREGAKIIHPCRRVIPIETILEWMQKKA